MFRERWRDRAPVAEVGQESAAAAAAPARAVDLCVFESRPITASYRQRNAALKWLRRVAGTAGGDVVCEATVQIGKIWKPPKKKGQLNMHHDFWDGEEVPWSWLEMFAQMGPATKAQGDKRGEHQDNDDFVVYRKDLSVVRSYPNWKTKKFDLREADPHASTVPPPRDGCGGSNGAGTYKYYKHVDRAGTGRFDRERGNGMSPGDLGYQSCRNQ
ncbi:unnamed protein product [Prorocentrum cordatum]|uniref:Uncharacterized protein n=1 Tax=Prorocentrum cordatum TaxID=2364126 RepID=A0ABN9Q7L3_9DINO|nr:unnamed protein product [Polarella glacialis]